MLHYQNYESGNDLNWFSDDPILVRYTKRYLSSSILAYVQNAFLDTGALAAGPIDKRAVHTDREGAPRLIRYNRKGEEINEIWYNEGYLKTVQEGYGTGVVSYRYDKSAPETIPFFVNAVLLFLLCEAENGFTCPVGLTQSVAFVLEKFGSKQQKETYLSRLSSTDPTTFAQGATWLTEIQGGSDVGATRTVAMKKDGYYELTGEKWFASNCDAEVSVTLARVNDQPSTKGLGLFLVPRTLPDGSRNRVTIRRLKDKLGVRAVASGELILNQAIGYLIGEEELGFKYMAEALNVSRLGTALGGLAAARRAFLEAAIYTSRREAFGQVIQKYPMVQETLTDMIVEIEAAWAVVAQMIQKFDVVHTYNSGNESDQSTLRILLSLAKYRCSELGVSACKRALELHGGNGYIEEYVTPRLLRDAIVNPVWEGTANIQALEILKILQKGGAAPICQDMTDTLESIHHDMLQETKEALRAEINRAGDLISYVLNQPPFHQQALAKKLADFLYDTFAAVHLLEEAQFDLMMNVDAPDARRKLAVEHWIRMVLNRSADRGICSQEVLTHEVAESLIAFRPYVCKQEVIQ